MRWLPRVPDAELAARPVLGAAGALASGMLAQPAPIRKRYAAIAESSIADAPEPVRIYVQAVAALTRGGLLEGDLDVALEDVRIAAGLARADVPLLVVGTLGVLSYIEYLAGDEAAAEAAALEALARPEAVERPHGLVYAHAVHALLESAAGLHEAAAVEARVAVGYARELGLAGTWSAGIAHHALGEALLGLGRLADAERELVRARELRHAVEPRLDTVHTLIQLARVRVARGRLTLAGSTLGSAYEQLNAFDEAGRLPGLAAEVDRALTDALAGNEAAVEPPTPAELSILQLLGSDMSQREIGEQLFLSLNTVKTHSRNLYAKLGAHSREEAVQRAYALGLIDHQSSAS